MMECLYWKQKPVLAIAHNVDESKCESSNSNSNSNSSSNSVARLLRLMICKEMIPRDLLLSSAYQDYTLMRIVSFLHSFRLPAYSDHLLKCVSQEVDFRIQPNATVQRIVIPNALFDQKSIGIGSETRQGQGFETMTISGSALKVASAPSVDQGALHQPSAPSPGLVLFNCEEQSDIIFNVGTDQDVVALTCWRFPAHAFIVAEASTVFAAIIRAQLDQYGVAMNGNKPEIFIHCQPEIFHIMLSYIYKKEVNISSVANALSLILASSKFRLHGLTQACLTFLQQKASHGNVLEILSWLRRVAPGPGLPEECGHNSAENALNELMTKCYQILDANAESVLRSEAVDSLEQEMLMEVLSRDSLRLASETTVFDCLLGWASQQCLKQRRELVGENKRDVLGNAVYSTRYLVMTLEEFIKGPYSSDLLTDEEKSAIVTRLKGDDDTPLPMHLLGRKLDVVRKYVKPTGLVSPIRRQPVDPAALPAPPLDPHADLTVSSVNRKKNSASKKLLNGLSGFMICVIQLLD